jgi:alcohol dehydrogenase class IV
MIRSFRFARTPAIIFGQGKLSELKDIARAFGNRMALVTGSRSFLSSDRAAALLNELELSKIAVRTVNISGEPSPEMIDEAVSILKEHDADIVVAIGGGSVLDAGKAVSAMLKVTGSVADFLEDVGKLEHPGIKVPFIAIPTTSGTGSEATKNAVISRVGKDGFKKSLRHDNIVPDFALVDPELTIRCPADITAASGMDCFTQLTEAFLSTKSCEYTDALSLEGIKAVMDCLERSYSNGEDIDARSGMSFAALTSGICLANAGLGVVHGFASSIGGLYNIPHGLICGTLMAVSNDVNIRRLQKDGSDRAALGKYAVLGRLSSSRSDMTDDYYTQSFIEYLYDLTGRLGLPGLASAGIRKDDLIEICRSTGIKNNPAVLDTDDLMEIVTRRFV